MEQPSNTAQCPAQSQAIEATQGLTSNSHVNKSSYLHWIREELVSVTAIIKEVLSSAVTELCSEMAWFRVNQLEEVGKEWDDANMHIRDTQQTQGR